MKSKAMNMINDYVICCETQGFYFIIPIGYHWVNKIYRPPNSTEDQNTSFLFNTFEFSDFILPKWNKIIH